MYEGENSDEDENSNEGEKNVVSNDKPKNPVPLK